MLDVEDGLLEQVAHVRVVQRIHGSSADAFAHDEPEMPEESQLMRHGGLLHADCLGKLADRAGRLVQPGEDADPASRRERLHRLRHLTCRLGIQQATPRTTAHAMAHYRIICTIVHQSSHDPGRNAYTVRRRRHGPPMTALRTVGIFLVAVLAELGGTYAVWRWLREDATALLAVVGLSALFAYAVVQTYQPEDRYGRVFAAYAGVFLIGATLWGWLVDGRRPDAFDVIGAGIVLVGIFVILAGRRVFA